MACNTLKLNEEKTEYLIIASKHIYAKAKGISTLKVGDIEVKESSTARNIGAIVDTHMDLDAHIKSVVKSCYMHLRAIS